MLPINHQFKLTKRPVGAIKHSDLTYTQESLRDLLENEVLIKILYISLDPAMRGWMRESTHSYAPPVAINEVMRAIAVGQIIASRHSEWALGDHVSGLLGMQEYAYSNGNGLIKIDADLAPLPVFLGALGMPGLTAYFGLLDIGQPQAGETIVVSAAAGAVGSIVGQIAKIKGCHVIGIAGHAEKCRYLCDELGFNAVINYKNEDVATRLQQLCPKGADIYFDNVGGHVLDAVLTCLAHNARIILCGAISQYNNTTPIQGPMNYLSLIVKRASMKGFLVNDYYHRASEALREMNHWINTNKLKTREDIIDGLSAFPDAFQKLFTGENKGKLILKI